MEGRRCCANRVKECQLDLDADRTGAATMRANQLRLWFSSLAYVLIEGVRRLGLAGTELAKATAGTIRLKLLKIGAVVTVSIRRIKLAYASACPVKEVFVLAFERLRRLNAPPDAAIAACSAMVDTPSYVGRVRPERRIATGYSSPPSRRT